MWISFLFLFGFAACYPYGSPKQALDEDVLAFMFDVQEALDMPYAKEYDEGIKTELGEKLRKELDDALEKIKEALEKGETIKESIKQKVKELKDRLKDLGEDFGKKAKELIGKIKDKIKQKFQELLERLGLKDKDEFAYTEFDEDDSKTELGEKLKKHLDHIIEQIKESIEKGKGIRDDLADKAKEIMEKLKDLKIDFGNKAKELLDKIRNKGKELVRKWLERLGLWEISEDEFAYTEFDEKDHIKELGERLKQKLDEVLEQMEDAVNKGKVVTEKLKEKFRDLKGKLQDLKVDIGNKAKELIKKIQNRLKEKFRELLEKLGINDKKEDEFAYTEFDEADPQTELGEKLKEHLDHILEQLRDGIVKGKGIKEDLIKKAKEIMDKLKDMKIDFGAKVKELLEKFKNKAKDFLQRFLEKLGLLDIIDNEFAYAEFDEEDPDKLKDKFKEILEKIKDALVNRDFKFELINQAKELLKKLHERHIEIGDKLKDLFNKVKERIINWWKELIVEEFSDTYDDIDLPVVLRGILDKIENHDYTEDIADYIKEKLGNAPLGEALIQVLIQDRTHLKQIVKALLESERDSRSLQDMYDRIKDYLKGLKEKYANFLNWVKDIYAKGKEAAKDKIDNIKDVAREFIHHTKKIKKEVAEEAIEFFRPYKEDLGTLWEEVKKTAKEVIGH